MILLCVILSSYCPSLEIVRMHGYEALISICHCWLQASSFFLFCFSPSSHLSSWGLYRMSEDSKEEDCLQQFCFHDVMMFPVTGRPSSTCSESKEEKLQGKKWYILVNCPTRVKEQRVDRLRWKQWQWGARTMPAPPLTMSHKEYTHHCWNRLQREKRLHGTGYFWV